MCLYVRGGGLHPLTWLSCFFGFISSLFSVSKWILGLFQLSTVPWSSPAVLEKMGTMAILGNLFEEIHPPAQ